MLSRWLATVLVSALALAALVGQPTSAGAGISARPTSPTGAATARWSGSHQPALVGVQYRGMWGDRSNRQRREMLDRFEAAGVEWIRVGVPWVMMQPRRPSAGDPGWAQFAFDRLSDIIRWANKRGIEVSGTFGRTPGWANGGKGDLYLADSPARFGRALQHIARVFRGRIDSWEIWNEPNHPNYLQGATPQDYVRALCAAHRAVHSAAPRTPVVAGGTAANDYRWYRALYRSAAKPCFDVLATHPYNSDRSPYFTPPTNAPYWFQNVTLVRRVMRRYHDLNTPIWFTEVGYSTHPDLAAAGQRGVTLAQQAKFLGQVFTITDRRYPYVRRVSWYMDQDVTISTVHKNRFGLFRVDMTPKPAYFALRKYTRTLNR